MSEELSTYPYRLYAHWNAGDLDRFYEMIDDDVKDHTGGVAGRGKVRDILTIVRSAFPDHHYVVDRVLVEGDFLSVWLTASGTQKGNFFGYPATGKHATWTEVRMVRIKDDRTAEHWASVDTLGMLVQLGHLTTPDRTQW